jgi:hypothetical protein
MECYRVNDDNLMYDWIVKWASIVKNDEEFVRAVVFGMGDGLVIVQSPLLSGDVSDQHRLEFLHHGVLTSPYYRSWEVFEYDDVVVGNWDGLTLPAQVWRRFDGDFGSYLDSLARDKEIPDWLERYVHLQDGSVEDGMRR